MSESEWIQVGEVEVLCTREFPLDPGAFNDPLNTFVLVEPGTYPVYRKFDVYCWIMRGRINERNSKISDGLFVFSGSDTSTGLEVQFPSRAYGAAEFKELLDDPMCSPGDAQRLRFSLDVSLP